MATPAEFSADPVEPLRRLRPPPNPAKPSDLADFSASYSAAVAEADRRIEAVADGDENHRNELWAECNAYADENREAWWGAFPRQRHPSLVAEDREFEQNATVLPDGRVLTGYGGLASFEDSDGTVYENLDAGPSPGRLARDRERARGLRARVMSERAMKARRRDRGCLAPTRRLPQARRPRPAARRRRTVSTRAGPDDSSGSSEGGGDQPPPPGPYPTSHTDALAGRLG